MSIARSLLISDERVAEIVARTGFADFLRLDLYRPGYLGLLRALAERWWDTTNTFHFPCGEMTVTPAELSLLTGARFGSRQLVYYEDVDSLSDDRLEELLGVVPSRPGGWVTRRWLHDTLERHYDFGAALYSPEQSARLCLLLIVGCSFWHSRRDTVNLSILRSFEDLTILSEYNWGGAMLCVMYREMTDLSRGVFGSLGGTHFIWEVSLCPSSHYLWVACLTDLIVFAAAVGFLPLPLSGPCP